jgi:hypothetical protein
MEDKASKDVQRLSAGANVANVSITEPRGMGLDQARGRVAMRQDSGEGYPVAGA